MWHISNINTSSCVSVSFDGLSGTFASVKPEYFSICIMYRIIYRIPFCLFTQGLPGLPGATGEKVHFQLKGLVAFIGSGVAADNM